MVSKSAALHQINRGEGGADTANPHHPGSVSPHLTEENAGPSKQRAYHLARPRHSGLHGARRARSGQAPLALRHRSSYCWLAGRSTWFSH